MKQVDCYETFLLYLKMSGKTSDDKTTYYQKNRETILGRGKFIIVITMKY